MAWESALPAFTSEQEEKIGIFAELFCRSELAIMVRTISPNRPTKQKFWNKCDDIVLSSTDTVLLPFPFPLIFRSLDTASPVAIEHCVIKVDRSRITWGIHRSFREWQGRNDVR